MDEGPGLIEIEGGVLRVEDGVVAGDPLETLGLAPSGAMKSVETPSYSFSSIVEGGDRGCSCCVSSRQDSESNLRH